MKELAMTGMEWNAVMDKSKRGNLNFPQRFSLPLTDLGGMPARLKTVSYYDMILAALHLSIG